MQDFWPFRTAHWPAPDRWLPPCSDGPNRQVFGNPSRSKVKQALVRLSMVAALTVITAGLVSAQTVLPLPNETGTSTLTATVSEQASFSVPSTVNFNVTNILVTT